MLFITLFFGNLLYLGILHYCRSTFYLWSCRLGRTHCPVPPLLSFICIFLSYVTLAFRASFTPFMWKIKPLVSPVLGSFLHLTSLSQIHLDTSSWIQPWHLKFNMSPTKGFIFSSKSESSPPQSLKICCFLVVRIILRPSELFSTFICSWIHSLSLL